jgi:hypothetical protein
MVNRGLFKVAGSNTLREEGGGGERERDMQLSTSWLTCNNCPYTSVLVTRRLESIQGLRKEPVDEQLRRYKSNWLRHATRMNSSRMSKIMLNCRPTGRRRLVRPWMRLR